MNAAQLTRDVWRVDAEEFPPGGSVEEQIRFLLRYAVLAPSSHNSQPWAFEVDGAVVSVRGVEDRWLREADPDKREFHIGLGCTVETLRIAARRFGLACRVVTPRSGPVVARAMIGPGGNPRRDAALFEEITERYTDHRPFRWTPIPTPVVETLREEVAAFDADLRLVREERLKRSIAELQATADRRQMASPAYRRELGRWIGTGALGASRLSARIGQAAVTRVNVGGREARRNSALIESAPAVAVLSTDGDDRVAHVATGRAFQRLALAASAGGLAVHPMSQILERPDERAALRRLLDLDGSPHHLFRLGFVGDRQAHTPRWPADAVTTEAS